MAGKALEVLAPVGRAGGGVLRRMLDIAIDGLPWFPSAKVAAGNQLQKSGDVEAAIDACVRTHIGLAGAQGFATNLGGIAALPVAVPSNIAGVAMVQLRLVACIAHLRGYNVEDARVRSAIMMCLLNAGAAASLADGLPGSPLVVATAPVFDPELDEKISERVIAGLLAQVGGTKASTIFARGIPIIGGGVGAVVDAWSTYHLADHAREALVDRRPRV